MLVYNVKNIYIIIITSNNNNNNNNNNNITQLSLILKKGSTGTSEENGSCILPHQCDSQQAVHLAQCLSFTFMASLLLNLE